jgi:hypothetical protein
VALTSGTAPRSGVTGAVATAVPAPVDADPKLLAPAPPPPLPPVPEELLPDDAVGMPALTEMGKFATDTGSGRSPRTSSVVSRPGW